MEKQELAVLVKTLEKAVRYNLYLKRIVQVGDLLDAKGRAFTRSELADAFLEQDRLAREALGGGRVRTAVEVDAEVAAFKASLDEADAKGVS